MAHSPTGTRGGRGPPRNVTIEEEVDDGYFPLLPVNTKRKQGFDGYRAPSAPVGSDDEDSPESSPLSSAPPTPRIPRNGTIERKLKAAPTNGYHSVLSDSDEEDVGFNGETGFGHGKSNAYLAVDPPVQAGVHVPSVASAREGADGTLAPPRGVGDSTPGKANAHVGPPHASAQPPLFSVSGSVLGERASAPGLVNPLNEDPALPAIFTALFGSAGSVGTVPETAQPVLANPASRLMSPGVVVQDREWTCPFDAPPVGNPQTFTIPTSWPQAPGTERNPIKVDMSVSPASVHSELKDVDFRRSATPVQAPSFGQVPSSFPQQEEELAPPPANRMSTPPPGQPLRERTPASLPQFGQASQDFIFRGARPAHSTRSSAANVPLGTPQPGHFSAPVPVLDPMEFRENCAMSVRADMVGNGYSEDEDVTEFGRNTAPIHQSRHLREVALAHELMTNNRLAMRALDTAAALTCAGRSIIKDAEPVNIARALTRVMQVVRSLAMAMMSPHCDHSPDNGCREFGNLILENGQQIFRPDVAIIEEINYRPVGVPFAGMLPRMESIFPVTFWDNPSPKEVNSFWAIKDKLAPHPFREVTEPNLPEAFARRPTNTTFKLPKRQAQAPAEASTQPAPPSVTAGKGKATRGASKRAQAQVAPAATTPARRPTAAASTDGVSAADHGVQPANPAYVGSGANVTGVSALVHAPRPALSGGAGRTASFPVGQAKQVPVNAGKNKGEPMVIQVGEIPDPKPVLLPAASPSSKTAGSETQLQPGEQVVLDKLTAMFTRVVAKIDSLDARMSRLEGGETTAQPTAPEPWHGPTPPPVNNQPTNPTPPPAPSPRPNQAGTGKGDGWSTVTGSKHSANLYASRAKAAAGKAQPAQSLETKGMAGQSAGTPKQPPEVTYIFQFGGDAPVMYIQRAARTEDLLERVRAALRKTPVLGGKVTVVSVGYTHRDNLKVIFSTAGGRSTPTAVRNVEPVLRAALNIADATPFVWDVPWGHVVIKMAPQAPTLASQESVVTLTAELRESNPLLFPLLKITGGPERTSGGRDIQLQFEDPNQTVAPRLINQGMWVYGARCHVRQFLEREVLLECARCHKIGHVERNCTAKVAVCAVCLGPHATAQHDDMCKLCVKAGRLAQDKCPHMKCTNCGANSHVSASMACPRKTHKILPRNMTVFGKKASDPNTLGKTVKEVQQSQKDTGSDQPRSSPPRIPGSAKGKAKAGPSSGLSPPPPRTAFKTKGGVWKAHQDKRAGAMDTAEEPGPSEPTIEELDALNSYSGGVWPQAEEPLQAAHKDSRELWLGEDDEEDVHIAHKGPPTNAVPK